MIAVYLVPFLRYSDGISSCAPVEKLKFVADSGPGTIKMISSMTGRKRQFNLMIICILKYSVWMKKPILFLMKEVIVLIMN